MSWTNGSNVVVLVWAVVMTAIAVLSYRRIRNTKSSINKIPDVVEPGEMDIFIKTPERNDDERTIYDAAQSIDELAGMIANKIIHIAEDMKVGFGITDFEGFATVAAAKLKREIKEMVPGINDEQVQLVFNAIFKIGTHYPIIERTYDNFINDYINRSSEYEAQVSDDNKKMGDVTDPDAVVEDMYKRDENGTPILYTPTKDTNDSFEETIPNTTKELEYKVEDSDIND